MLPSFAPPGIVPLEGLIKLYTEKKPMNYVMVQGGMVINVIDWDGVTPYTPPEGCELYVWSGPVSIGWAWAEGAPVNPNPPIPVETVAPPESGGPAIL